MVDGALVRALRQRMGQDMEQPTVIADVAQPRAHSVQDQFEIGEIHPGENSNYPTGARLAVVALSLGLALLVFGLASLPRCFISGIRADQSQIRTSVSWVLLCLRSPTNSRPSQTSDGTTLHSMCIHPSSIEDPSKLM